jgi:hypothetical protein
VKPSEKWRRVEAVLDEPASTDPSTNELARRAGVAWSLADKVRCSRRPTTSRAGSPAAGVEVNGHKANGENVLCS